MKLFLCLLFAASSITAAEIQIIVRNTAGTVVSNVTMTCSDAVVKAVNDWRLEQVEKSAVQNADGTTTPAVLRFPTAADLWKRIIGGFVRSVVADKLAIGATQRQVIATAQAEIEAANAAVIQ